MAHLWHSFLMNEEKHVSHIKMLFFPCSPLMCSKSNLSLKVYIPVKPHKQRLSDIIAHWEERTNMQTNTGENQLEVACTTPQETQAPYAGDSVIQNSTKETQIQSEQSCTSEDSSYSTDITAPMILADAHPRAHKKITSGRQLTIWFVAAWEWVMHVEGCLWKPLEGWICGIWRPSDPSSTAEIYKYLKRDKEGQLLDVDCGYVWQNTHLSSAKNEYTCAHTRTKAPQKTAKEV